LQASEVDPVLTLHWAHLHENETAKAHHVPPKKN
jgi:hypothetical protein